ncbi:hypothetical protein AUK22_02635 [bacterium CG2_30_54_10]|nr:MAG: hypothetical protein AUK22_02635 [bacterium CG2_30_54_10]
MKIESHVDKEKQQATFLIEGELDVHQVKILKSTVTEAVTSGNWTYTIDLQKVIYLDSSGLGMLVFLKKEIVRRGGKLKLTNLGDGIRSVFQLTKLDDFFGIK